MSFPLFCEAEKGFASGRNLGKLGSAKMVSKKGFATMIEYKLLEKGTDNFRDSNILGQGGFGCVYKACLDDNQQVAVKKLNCTTPDAEREFKVPIFEIFGF